MAESSSLHMALRLRGQRQSHFGYRDQIKARVKYTLSDVKNRAGVLWLLLGGFAFSVNGTVSKLVLTNGLSGWRLAQIRAIGAAIIMIVYVLIKKRSELKVKLREIPQLIIYGAVGIALVNVGYFIGIARMHVSITLIIEFTAPIWVALWVKFIRKEHVANSMWLSLLVSIIGLITIAQVWQGLTLDAVGLMAAFLSAFALAAYFLIGEKIKDNHSATSMLTWGLIGAAVFWLLTIPIWSYPTEIFTKQIDLQGKLVGTTLPGWSLVAWVVIMGTIVPYICVIQGLRKTSAAVAGVISMSEAIMAGAIAWFWLGESWNLIQLIGGALVIAGIFMAERSRITQNLLVG